MSSTRRLSYWVVPCADDTARFFDVVSRLARVRNAPVFSPHMSLISIEGEQPDLSSCLDLLRGLEVQPVEIGMTDAFTMSLFVRMEPHPALLEAREFLLNQPRAKSSRDFDPHLSLCYGAPPEGAADWDQVRALLDQPVRFDALRSVVIPPIVETDEDVRRWREVQTFPF